MTRDLVIMIHVNLFYDGLFCITEAKGLILFLSLLGPFCPSLDVHALSIQSANPGNLLLAPHWFHGFQGLSRHLQEPLILTFNSETLPSKSIS